MMVEIYKIIDGYENYSVSNTGKVKNTTTGEMVRQYVYDTNGTRKANKYVRVCLKSNGKHSVLLLHVLIARSFIQNLDNKPRVDHIDRVKTNNNVDNLRWVTQEENQMNRNKHCNNTSGYSGVSFHKQANKWRAGLNARGKTYTKIFETIEEAIEYRAGLEKIHFGIYSPNQEKNIVINIINNF